MVLRPSNKGLIPQVLSEARADSVEASVDSGEDLEAAAGSHSQIFSTSSSAVHSRASAGAAAQASVDPSRGIPSKRRWG